MTYPNPYNIPVVIDWNVTLKFLGFIGDGTDYTVNDGVYDQEWAYDTITWITATPKPTWSTILANYEEAWITDYPNYAPLHYWQLVTEYDINALESAVDGKANISHTHVANDITNATTVGKSVLTAADAAAARTAIGAGTSSFTGAYNDLTGKPSLATVATSGSYNDLTAKPTIPSAQVQSDWTQTSTGSVDYVKNKPAKMTSVGSQATNSPTDAPTNLNVLTTLLGTLTGEVNATNQRQNTIATNLNALATAFNTAVSELKAKGYMNT